MDVEDTDEAGSFSVIDSVVNDVCEKYHELCLEVIIIIYLYFNHNNQIKETHAEMMTLKRELLEHATNRDRSISADVT